MIEVGGFPVGCHDLNPCLDRLLIDVQLIEYAINSQRCHIEINA